MPDERDGVGVMVGTGGDVGAGTLPHGATPKRWVDSDDLVRLTTANRTTRLASVALCSGVFQHFYPYFDVVAHERLAEIVGAPTAGANGNVNPFELPGGDLVMWTGMKVLKHDGAQHHAVGILPTVPIEPTQKGIAEGRDEVLEKAVEVLKGKLADG